MNKVASQPPGEKSAVFTAMAFPRVKLEDLAGKLIVVEGADGSGRSTQIARLVDWLETSGHADGAGRPETLHARQRGTGKGAGGKYFEPDDAEPVLRDGFCRPVGKHHFAGAQGGFHRAGRPLHLHAHGARHGARHGRGVAEKSLRHRAGTGRGVLSFRRNRRNWCSATLPKTRRWIIGKAAWTSAFRATCSTAS